MFVKFFFLFQVINISCCASNEIGERRPRKEVCYKEVGCFPMGEPFYKQPDRPLPAPENPAFLKVFVNFFSRSNRNASVNIDLFGPINMQGAPYKGNRNKTVFILAGGGQNGRWPTTMKDALLKRLDANVFYVNTSFAFRSLQVLKAASNARVIGVQIARFIKHLEKNYGLNPAERVWMIGYGLGAHVAGYTGKKVKIARITGLDPMEEFFEGYPAEVRLDKEDALFVDVVHTDARPLIPDIGFGYINPLGHTDFYVNGGHGQPGCRLPSPFEFQFIGELTDIIERFVKVWASAVYCSHKRAFQLFIEAIQRTDCTIWGHSGTIENFLRSISNGGSEGILLSLTALSGPCNITNCSPMGINTPASPKRGVVIVTTKAESPYCTKVDQTEGNRPAVEGQLGRYVASALGYDDQHTNL